MAAPETSVDAQADNGAAGVSVDAPPGHADLLPGQLGTWNLSASVTGETALLQVEQLHGKALGEGITDAWVGQYGVEDGGQPPAMVWISRSPGEASARELLQRMTDRISEGNSPFTGLRPMANQSVEGYALDGMGQTHYYFLVGTDLYWLAVDPDQAEAILDELVGWASGQVSSQVTKG